MTIRSPCVKKCNIEEIGGVDTCTGCYRTLNQVRDWSKYTDQERDEIMDELPSTAYNTKVGVHEVPEFMIGGEVRKYTVSFHGHTREFSTSVDQEKAEKYIDDNIEIIRKSMRLMTKIKYL